MKNWYIKFTILFLFLFLSFLIFHDSKELNVSSIKREQFAMYYQKSDKSGYVKDYREMLLSGYVINKTLSQCRDINNNIVENNLTIKDNKVSITSNKTIFCVLYFDIAEYSITYILNGGTNPTNQINTFAPGDSLSILNPTKTNANFDGWYKESDFSGTVVTSTSDLNGDTTLYAKWIDVYTITYELDGGTNPANQVTTFTSINSQSILAPTKTNANFDGWYRESDFSGTVVTSTSDLNGDTTLYAKWSTSGGGMGTPDNPYEDTTTTVYDPVNNPTPSNSTIIYKEVAGDPKVSTDSNGNITSFEYTDISTSNPVSINSNTTVSTGFIPFDGSSDWELNMVFSYDSEENSITTNSNIVTILGCSDWSTGSMTSGFAFKFYNFKNTTGTTYRYNGMLKYRPILQVENNGEVDTLYGLYTTGSNGVLMTSPMKYTFHIVKNGSTITFEISNGSKLTYHPTSNSNSGYSTANANTTKTVTWHDNSSSDVDIIIGGYLGSNGNISQKANMDVYSFSVHKTN